MCAVVQARLPEIEELQKQITASCEELAELDFRATEERAAAAARETALKVIRCNRGTLVSGRAAEVLDYFCNYTFSCSTRNLARHCGMISTFS